MTNSSDGLLGSDNVLLAMLRSWDLQWCQNPWLSIGFLPQVRAQATFAPLSKGVPQVVKILNMRISSQDRGVVAL